jgi:hypothetical protein
MIRQCLALLLLLFTPTALMPQRYGRPYTLAENPQLLLEIRVQKEDRYFRVADLHKMQRSTVTLTDPATNTSHVYQGVALEQLVPNSALSLKNGSIEIEFGSHKTLTITISGIDLDPQTRLLVVDTVDGKPLSGYAPYYLVTRSRGKPQQTITDVQRITIKSST